MAWNDDLIKRRFWYLGVVNKWQTKLYGFPLFSGVVDLISNNTKMIMLTKDKSPWAYECLERCFDLLLLGIRWTDEIDQLIPNDRQCKTRLCSFLNKRWFRLVKKIYKYSVSDRITIKFRSQGDMTRDPYVNAICCAVYLDRLDFIYIVSMPWYLWRPAVWKWHKYLKDPTEKNYKRWEWSERVNSIFQVPEFVEGLQLRRRKAVELIKLKQ